jgi:osmotically-inducible protein OsmY
MVTTTRVRTDHDLQAVVQEELRWTPDVDADAIGVAVDDGTVRLSGEVRTFSERVAALRATERVRGVRAVIDDITVHPSPQGSVSETDVAKEVARALSTSVNVPGSIRAEVHGHAVVLIGEAEWDYQRAAARRAVQVLPGVLSVDNRVTLTARPSAPDARERIARAIARNALLDADSIHVAVTGTTVTLTGSVRSWAARRQAAQAAWASPHVTAVDNRLAVSI